MKTITIEQALEMGWCYDEKKLRDIAGDKEHWSALDILNLPGIPDNDKLYSVLNVALIDEPILHEFACRCAERALSKIENHDPRSIAAIAAKRAWLRGEITDDDLYAARKAAGEAAREAARESAWEAAREAAMEAAREAARGAAWRAAWEAAGRAAWVAAREAARESERQWQVEELKRMLEAEK